MTYLYHTPINHDKKHIIKMLVNISYKQLDIHSITLFLFRKEFQKMIQKFLSKRMRRVQPDAFFKTGNSFFHLFQVEITQTQIIVNLGSLISQLNTSLVVSSRFFKLRGVVAGCSYIKVYLHKLRSQFDDLFVKLNSFSKILLVIVYVCYVE